MGTIKVVVADEVERRFRRVAMGRYGYGRGALSEAAEAALSEWSSAEDMEMDLSSGLEDPVSAIEGLLARARTTSVELQHEARRIRVRRSRAETSG